MFIIKLVRLVVVFLSRIYNHRPVLFGFDPTDRCNLHCPTCYKVPRIADVRMQSVNEIFAMYPSVNRVLELSVEKIVQFFRDRLREGFIAVFIKGGEPYLRPELLPKITRIIPFTAVITSGDLLEGQHFQNLPGLLHFVSMDAAEYAKHDKMRGKPGLSHRVEAELCLARSRGGFPVVIHVVFDSRNYMDTEEIVRHWKNNGLADGVVFSCMTPNHAVQNKYRLKDDMRRKIVRDLTRMKSMREFRDFVLVSTGAIADMLPEHVHAQTEETCPTIRFSRSYDLQGNPVPRCEFGPGGVCSECGCIVTMQFGGLTRWRGWRNLLSDLWVAYRFGRIFLKSYR